MRGDVSWKDSTLSDPLIGTYRKARTGVHRLIHPVRRSLVRRRMADLAPVGRVVILCLGNICRSPYGEARLRQMDGGRRGAGFPRLEIRSAGLMGPERPSPKNARSAAKKRGLDLESHTSQLLDSEMAAWAELFVVMDPEQARFLASQLGASPGRIVVLGDLDPGSPARRDIPDPFESDEAFFLDTYERMDRCLDELFGLIGGGS